MAASLSSIRSADESAQLTFAVSALPAANSGYWVYLETRLQANQTATAARLKINPDGTVYLDAVTIDAGVVKSLPGRTKVPGKISPGRWYTMAVRTVGSAPAHVMATAWPAESTSPGWLVNATTTDPAVSGVSGSVGFIALNTDAEPITLHIDAIYGWPITNSITNSTPTFPGPTTTGVPAGTVLTRHSGTVMVTTAGTVIDGWDLHGTLIIKAPGVIVKNSIIRGEKYTSAGKCLINATANVVSNLQITNTEITPEYPSVNVGGGICGHDLTADRVDIHGAVDGVDIFGSNVTVQASWIHDLPYYALAPDHLDGSHNDGVQISGGSNLRIVQNHIAGGPHNNAAVFVAQELGRVSDVVVRENLLDFGTYTVKLNPAPRSTLATVSIESNYIGSNQKYGKYAALVLKGASVQYTDNVWLATGLPAPAAIVG